MNRWRRKSPNDAFERAELQRLEVEQRLSPETIAFANGTAGRPRIADLLHLRPEGTTRHLEWCGTGGSGSSHVEGGTEERVVLRDIDTGETFEIEARVSTGGHAHLLIFRRSAATGGGNSAAATDDRSPST